MATKDKKPYPPKGNKKIEAKDRASSNAMRREKLVQEYFKRGFSKLEAAKACGYASPKERSSELFAHPEVVRMIKERQEASRRKYEVTVEWIVERLMKLADANTGDVMLKLKQNDYDLAALTPDERYVISELVEETRKEGRGPDAQEVSVVKVKAEARLGHLVALAKHLGMMVDRTKIDLGDDVVALIQAGRNRVGDEDA